MLNSGGHMDLYLRPAALEEKYHREKTPPHRSIGIAGFDEQTLRQRTQSLTWTPEPMKLMEAVHVTGEIPRRNGFEDTGGPFYRDRSCTVPHPLSDDQVLYIETCAGLVVVLGCAHAGVVNTLDYIAELTDQDRVQLASGCQSDPNVQRTGAGNAQCNPARLPG